MPMNSLKQGLNNSVHTVKNSTVFNATVNILLLTKGII